MKRKSFPVLCQILDFRKMLLARYSMHTELKKKRSKRNFVFLFKLTWCYTIVSLKTDKPIERNLIRKSIKCKIVKVS